ERHLYKINWTNFKMQRLDNSEGMHAGTLSSDGNYLYDTYSNANAPRVGNIINTANLKSTNILTSENPLKNYQRPEIKNVELKAD
ncbi:DPP IV N-terminal domain-containing protein, partial [Chryseobacterium sp. SIMBA_029]